MCGVFSYVGQPLDLGGTLIRGLQTLEYRGYDSWGIALGHDRTIAVDKRIGRISRATTALTEGAIGIGHTRWATHGGVTAANAHPHLDCTGRLAVVHNGIIENHGPLRAELVAAGHHLKSETDSELVAHLVEQQMTQGRDVVSAVSSVFCRLEGFNAIVVMDVLSQQLIATKAVSPLVAGTSGAGSFLASDALALQPHVKNVVYLEDDHLAILNCTGIKIVDRATLHGLPPVYVQLDRDLGDADLGSYPYFMAKEMAEQPAVIERLGATKRHAIEALAAEITSAPTTLLGCGTALNAALTGSYLFARIAELRVNIVPASEFTDFAPVMQPDELVVGLSQSGETADMIEAMMLARTRGAKLAALVNAAHSTLDRMVDCRVHLGAGPEQCVLATKSYIAKVAALLLTAHACAGTYDRGVAQLHRAAGALSQLLAPARAAEIRDIAETIHQADHLFVIGRGLAYPTALEAALKIKEVSYIHAEGFAAGELKHGVIALVDPGTPCLVFAPKDETRSAVLSSATELKSRGAFVIGIGPEADDVFDRFVAVPDVGEAAPIVNALPAQQLAYHLALLRGNDPDRPRNLAKSVTVK